ncbi:MAG TPA: universal stress protein [Methylomirabilota bacterium]|jgi:nucleotide-binding universal stress UspA family protein|nr:universal stress protein [Methylomirabilota bacterium]
MTQLFNKILCPVYFDETSPVALEYARHFAQQSDGVIYLLHVVPTDELHLLRKVYEPERGGGADTVWAERVSRDKLQALARAHLTGIRQEIVTRLNSDPATGILEATRELAPDLVVMGTHGRTGISHLLLGSVAEKVVRESRCPVFTTHRGDALADTKPFQHILVPIDIAEQSAEPLRCARRIAEYSQGTVYPLHVVPTDETDLALRDVYEAREGARANLVKAETVARQKLESLARTYLSGVRYQTELHVSGDPAKTILEIERAVGADLLIMATHGFHGVFHLLLGSLTEKMMREANCPVLSLRQSVEPPRPKPSGQ